MAAKLSMLSEVQRPLVPHPSRWLGDNHGSRHTARGRPAWSPSEPLLRVRIAAADPNSNIVKPAAVSLRSRWRDPPAGISGAQLTPREVVELFEHGPREVTEPFADAKLGESAHSAHRGLREDHSEPPERTSGFRLGDSDAAAIRPEEKRPEQTHLRKKSRRARQTNPERPRETVHVRAEGTPSAGPAQESNGVGLGSTSLHQEAAAQGSVSGSGPAPSSRSPSAGTDVVTPDWGPPGERTGSREAAAQDEGGRDGKGGAAEGARRPGANRHPRSREGELEARRSGVAEGLALGASTPSKARAARERRDEGGQMAGRGGAARWAEEGGAASPVGESPGRAAEWLRGEGGGQTGTGTSAHPVHGAGGLPGDEEHGGKGSTSPAVGDGSACCGGLSRDVPDEGRQEARKDGAQPAGGTEAVPLKSRDELRATRAAWMAHLAACAEQGRGAAAEAAIQDMLREGFRPPPAAFHAAARAVIGEGEARRRGRAKVSAAREAGLQDEGGRAEGKYSGGRTEGEAEASESPSEAKSCSAAEPSTEGTRQPSLPARSPITPECPNDGRITAGSAESAAASTSARVQALFHLMQQQQQGAPPNKQARVLLAEALLRDGRTQAGHAACEALREEGLAVPLYLQRLLLRCWAAARCLAEAEQAVRDLLADGGGLQLGELNAMLAAYVVVGAYGKAEDVYSGMEALGVAPNTQTHVLAVRLHCLQQQPSSAASVLRAMQQRGEVPWPDEAVAAVLAAFTRSQELGEAEGLFAQHLQLLSRQASTTDSTNLFPGIPHETPALQPPALLSSPHQPHHPDFSALIGLPGALPLAPASCRAMLVAFQRSGQAGKAERLLQAMQEAGMPLSSSDQHSALHAYVRAGDAAAAAALAGRTRGRAARGAGSLAWSVDAWEEEEGDGEAAAGDETRLVQLTSLMQAYAEDGDYASACACLEAMSALSARPSFKTWAAAISAASRAPRKRACMQLLRALAGAGLDLPLRLLHRREPPEVLLAEAEARLRALQADGEASGAASLANVLLDLLWCFGRKGLAAGVLQAALGAGVYPMFRASAEEGQWHADFRGLSAGAALVALHWWLEGVQGAALEGRAPQLRVFIVTGGGRRRAGRLSLRRTVRMYLWAMNSPFRVTNEREGALVAKGYSLDRWVKDSTHCLELSLHDEEEIPRENLMEEHEGALMLPEVVRLMEDVEEGQVPFMASRVMSRLLRIPEERRKRWIELQHSMKETREERLDKRLKKKEMNRLRRRQRSETRYHRNPYK